MARNPFRYLKPVPPKLFLGRWPLVEAIGQDLLLDDGDSHAFIGGRRFGKTTLLKTLRHYLCEPEARQSDQVVLPIYFTFEERNFISERHFFATLLQEVRRRVDIATQRAPKYASPVKVHLNHEWLDGLLTGSPPALSFDCFKEALLYIIEQLEQAGGPTRLVVLLDEVDRILDYPWKRTLFGQLRAATSDDELEETMRLVLAGSRHFLDEVSQRGSPLWNVLKLHYLSTFDEATTEKLCQRAIGLPNAAQEAVWQQSGGHPFLAQYLLHHLFEQGISQSNESTVSQVANKFLYQRQPDLEGWASALEVTGLQVYRQFIKQSEWLDERDILRAFNTQKVPVKRGLVALCYHGFIVHDGHWNRYRRSSELLHNWYMQEGERLIKALSAEPQSANQILSFEECAQLVQHLLAIPSIADRDRRSTVIQRLRVEIKRNVRHSSVDKDHVLNMVYTCLEYPNGMQELRDRLQFFEGESIPMQRFKECLTRLSIKIKSDRARNETQSSLFNHHS